MADLASHLRHQMPRYELMGDERLERAQKLLGEAPEEELDLSEHHVGGGWYQIGDQKVQGKESAAALLKEE